MNPVYHRAFMLSSFIFQRGVNLPGGGIRVHTGTLCVHGLVRAARRLAFKDCNFNVQLEDWPWPVLCDDILNIRT